MIKIKLAKVNNFHGIRQTLEGRNDKSENDFFKERVLIRIGK